MTDYRDDEYAEYADDDPGDADKRLPGRYADDPPEEFTPPNPRRLPRSEARRPDFDAPPAGVRPALPRQERQARPMPAPPPDPRQGYAPDVPPDYPAPRSRRREAAPAPASPRRSRRDSGFYLPWWSLLVMLIFVGAAAVGAWAVVDSIGGSTAPGGQTPVVIVVTATFTVGPPPSQTPLPPPPTALPPVILPTLAATPTLPPANITIGAVVEVVGTGVLGLNVRSGPGTDSVVRFQALEGSRWIIKSGPQNASGEEWWELQDPNDATKGGWAARRYLQSPSN